MEFTCLWSKDAQQKKRKRWTDGVVRYSPSTGFLSVWDQDESVKVSSTRLKHEEASAILQENADEARFGSISVQIMANVTTEQQQQQQNDAHNLDAVPAQSATASGVATSGKGWNSSKPAARGPGFVRRKLGVSSKMGSAGRLSPHATGPLAGVEGCSSSNSSSGLAAAGATAAGARTLPSIAAGSLKRTGLGGGGRGVSGARRFHAPRLSSSVPAAAAAAGDGGDRALTSKLSPAVPSWGRGAGKQPAPAAGSPRPAAADSDNGGGCAANVATTAGAKMAAEISSGNRRGAGAASTAAAAAAAATVTAAAAGANPEGLVLEWTAGNPPKPVMAGASLARRLHPHQREGLRVLWECLAGRGGYDGRGAILADEMGLGKTATAIALCTCVLRHRRAECKKAIVVCPSSLVRNWVNEFKKWCPLGAGAIAVDQAGAAAAQLVADFKIGAPARYPILVISYELYRNHGKVINATEGLGLLIADEGHRLKNSAETKTTKALKACPAAMRLVLTGTPMQNDLDEFFAVADFVNPGLLGSLKGFRSRYTRPIKAAWDREADDDVSELSAERTRELAEITGKFVLRRTKDVIRGSLPPALEVVVFCRPSPRQLSLYETCIQKSEGARSLLYGGGGFGGGAERRRASGGGRESGEEVEEEEEEEDEEEDEGGEEEHSVSLQGVLPLISTLRRLCNHPDLIAGRKDGAVGAGANGGESTVVAAEIPDVGPRGEDRDDDDDDDEAVGKENSTTTTGGGGGRPGAKGLWKVPRSVRAVGAAATSATSSVGGVRGRASGSTAGGAPAAGKAEPGFETEASGKVVVLEALLKTVRREFPADKVVVTSNFTSALDVLGKLAGRNGWGSLRLDGGTASNGRQHLVDRFNKARPEDLFLFLLSAKAGGVGLNLVGANRIVLFDSDWNPATDDQAMARVWRLGQTKQVSMYRLLSTGTLEESIFQRQIFKGALYDLIHDSNEGEEGGGSRAGTRQEKRQGARGGGGNGDSATAPAPAAATKGGAGRSSRGFSRDELKELFVLKTATRSDTYDKLRRGRTAAAAASAAEATATTATEGGRYGLATADEEAGRGCQEAGGAEGGATATAGAGVPVDEAWKHYAGPSEVSDKALRLALLAGEAGGGGASGDGTMASSAVTYVREVKRGGRTEQQMEQHERAEAASRSPFGALGGAKENGSSVQESG